MVSIINCWQITQNLFAALLYCDHLASKHFCKTHFCLLLRLAIKVKAEKLNVLKKTKHVLSNYDMGQVLVYPLLCNVLYPNTNGLKVW